MRSGIAHRRTAGILALFCVLLSGGLVAAGVAVWQTDRDMRDDLLWKARMAARAIKLDHVRALSGTRADLEDPGYVRLQRQISSVLSANPEYVYAYLMGRADDGTIFFFLDTQQYDDEEDPPSQPGDVYADASAELRGVFDTAAPIVEGPLPDEWGVWVSALVPLVDPDSGEVLALFGVDIDAAQWKRHVVARAAPFLCLTGLLVAVGITGVILLERRGRAIKGVSGWRRYLEPGLAAAIGLILTLMAAWMAHNSQANDRGQTFRQVAQSKAAILDDAFRDLTDIELEGLARFFESSVHVDAAEFERYTGYLVKNRAVLAWAWAPAVPAESRGEAEAQAHAEGMHGFRVWEMDANGRRVPAGRRDTYYPVFFSAPVEGAEGVLGFDLGSEPVRRAALEAAASTGLITSTDPIVLVEGQEAHKSVLVCRPVFADVEGEPLVGLAVAVLNVESMLGMVQTDDTVVLGLSFGRPGMPPEPLMASLGERDVSVQPPEFTEAFPLLAFGKTFFVDAQAGPGFANLYPAQSGSRTLLSGLLLTIALTAIIALTRHRRARLEELVAVRTSELAEEREHLELALAGADLATWDWNTITGDAVFNDRWAAMLGYSLDEIACHVDTWKRLLHPDDAEAAVQALDAHLEGKTESYAAEYRMRHKTGRWVWNLAKGRVIERDQEGAPVRACGTQLDITARKEAEAVLERRLEYEAAAAESVAILAESGPLDARLGRVLEVLRETAEASRTYIFENEDIPGAGLCTSQILESCAPGIAPQIDNPELRHMSYSTVAPSLLSALLAREPFTKVVAELDLSERGILEAQSIKSVLILPIYAGDELWGFIGFDDCVSPRRWSREDMRILQTVADAAASAIVRSRSTEALARRVEFERLAAVVSADLASALAEGVDGAIDTALASVGTFSEADRAYVFQFRDGGERADNTHEWCAEGIEAHIEGLQGLFVDESLPYFAACMRNNEIFHVPDVSALPAEARLEREHLQSQGIQSLICIPMRAAGHLLGFLGFDMVGYLHAWPEDDSTVLSLIAEAFANVLARQQAERLAAARELYLHTVLQTTAEGFWVLDAAGRMHDVNDAFCAMTGYDRGELLGMSMNDIEAIETPAETLARKQCIIQHRKQLFETRHRRKDGSLYDVEISVTYLGDDGGQLICFGRDITERRRAERERIEMERQIQQTQKLESLGVLAGGIAHDFNNLLMAILGHAELALDDLTPTSPARASLEQIEIASRRAAELCRQMLAYSGKGHFLVEPFEIGILIEEMTHLLKTSISKKVRLNLDIDADLPKITGDATQIRQVIMNLVINASEAIGDESGVIAISAEAAVLSAEDFHDCCIVPDMAPEAVAAEQRPDGGRYVCIEVADTGCGMDRATLERVFEPFFSTKFTGRGLGMAAVLGIVRGHAGAMRVHSEPGKGTTFQVYLPAVEVSGAASESSNDVASGRPRPGGTILFADDEEIVRELGKKMLEHIGFEVLSAIDGQEAVRVYEENAQRIDAVLLDLAMPNMNGEEAFEALRSINPDVSVVIASGYDEYELERRLAGKGLAGFIQKPYDLSVLRESLYGLFQLGKK